MNKKRRLNYFLVLAGLFVVFLGSIWFYHHQFFRKTATGLEYRIVSKGKGPSPQEGEILLLNLSYKTPKGSVLFSTESQELPLIIRYSPKDIPPEENEFAEAISMLQKGDSLIFKLSTKKVFGENLSYIAQQYGLKQDTKVFLHLQLKDIMTEEAYQKWESEKVAALQKRRQEKTDQQFQENAKAIDHSLAEHQIAAQMTASGLRYVIDIPGRGIQPRKGDTVKVNYTGSILGGKVFDTSIEDVARQNVLYSTKKDYKPLEFQVGAQQVIKGWEEGIELLNKGSKARLFIPSTLAYGEQNIGKGMIPPNAVLVFEVELVDVQR